MDDSPDVTGADLCKMIIKNISGFNYEIMINYECKKWQWNDRFILEVWWMVVSDTIITDTLLHVTFSQEQSLAAIEALLETCASEFPEAPEQLYAIKDLDQFVRFRWQVFFCF